MGNGNAKSSQVVIRPRRCKFLSVVSRSEKESEDFVIDSSFHATTPISPRSDRESPDSSARSRVGPEEIESGETSQSRNIKRIDVTNSLSYWRRPNFKKTSSTSSLSNKKKEKSPIQRSKKNSQISDISVGETLIPVEQLPSDEIFEKQGFYKERPKVLVGSYRNVHHMKLIRTTPPVHSQTSIEEDNLSSSHHNRKQSHDIPSNKKKGRAIIPFTKSIVPSREKIFNVHGSTSSCKEHSTFSGKVESMFSTLAGKTMSPSSLPFSKSQLTLNSKSPEATFKLKEQILKEKMEKQLEDSKMNNTLNTAPPPVRRTRAERKWKWIGAHGEVQRMNL
jgi:predicted RNA binding protein YcfA (HicA-like mRNA interferase family)